MNARLPIAGLMLLVSCTRGHTRAPAPETLPDSVRGERLAAAAKSGARRANLVPNTGRLMVSPDAIMSGEGGAAIVAAVVRPDGRVDKATRTVVYLDGHPTFAKSICDFVGESRFAPAPPDERGTLGFMPISFENGGMRPPGARPTRPDSNAAVARRMRAVQPAIDGKLASMTEAETRDWFSARPTCASIRSGK